MKKLLKPLFVATLAVPALAFADTAPQTTTVEKVQAATGAGRTGRYGSSPRNPRGAAAGRRDSASGRR